MRSNAKVGIDMDDRELNLPETIAEVRAAFLEYEAALVRNDVKTLNDFFWDSPTTVRYGLAEHCYGAAEIHAYRETATAVAPSRRLSRTVITSYGRVAASVVTEFTVPDDTLIGRQTQTWMRMHTGWKIVAAHVSVVPRALIQG